MVLCKACDKYLELLRNDGQHPNYYPNQDGQDMNKLIVDFCKEPSSVQEIMNKFAFDSRTSFRRNIFHKKMSKPHLNQCGLEKIVKRYTILSSIFLMI